MMYAGYIAVRNAVYISYNTMHYFMLIPLHGSTYYMKGTTYKRLVHKSIAYVYTCMSHNVWNTLRSKNVYNNIYVCKLPPSVVFVSYTVHINRGIYNVGMHYNV